MIDFDKIRKNSKLARTGFYHVVGAHYFVREAEFDALVEEVERLRAEADEMRRWAEEAAHAENLNAQDAQKERAAVVAWLDAQLPDADFCDGCGQRGTTVDRLADAIERGEHRREEKP